MESIKRTGIGLMTAVALCACGPTDGGAPLASESVAASVEALEELDDEAQAKFDTGLLEIAVPETAPDGSVVWVLPAPEVIAHLTTSDGRTAEFNWSSDTNDLIYVEVVAAGQSPLFSDDVSLLERYLLLAPEGADVPRVLVAHDDSPDQATLLAGRDIVAAVPPMTVPPARLAALPVLPATASCGSTAAASFAANRCWYLNNNLIAPNRHDPLWCCDENFTPAGDAYDTSSTSTGCLDNPASGNSVWTTLIRKNSARRWNSFSSTAACGSSVNIEHSYLDVFGNTHIIDKHINAADGQVVTVFYKGGAKRYRKLRNITLGAGGLRAYSEFTNNF